MTIKLLTEHHLAFLTLKRATQARLSTLACGEGLTGDCYGCCLLWGSSSVVIGLLLVVVVPFV